MLICGLVLWNSSLATASNGDLLPLQLYWSADRGDNFVTATHQGSNAAIAANYSYIRNEACLLSSQQPGSKAFNLYWSSGREDNFTTATNTGARDARAAGYKFVRIEGYAYPASKCQ